jgi:hypothetical protein
MPTKSIANKKEDGLCYELISIKITREELSVLIRVSMQYLQIFSGLWKSKI